MSSNPTYDFVAAPHIGRVFTRHILVRWDSGAWKERKKVSQDVLRDFHVVAGRRSLQSLTSITFPSM
jgi:hypothetical protein